MRCNFHPSAKIGRPSQQELCDLMPLVNDIMEYVRLFRGRFPTLEEVIDWAQEFYNAQIGEKMARKLIKEARERIQSQATSGSK